MGPLLTLEVSEGLKAAARARVKPSDPQMTLLSMEDDKSAQWETLWSGLA